MFSDFVNDGRVRLLYWHRCEESWLEEFLDDQDDHERAALLAHLDEVGCEGVDACLGTFFLTHLEGDEHASRGIELMALIGTDTRLILSRRGEDVLVVEAGNRAEKIDPHELRDRAEQQFNLLARHTTEGKAHDGTR